MPQTTTDSQLLRPRHDGKAMHFHCIDDYFSNYHHRRVSRLGQSFAPSLAGGGLAFLLEATQVAACMQVAAGCVISNTQDLYLLSHIDCGAYKYFGGVDWHDHSYQAQIASLWRDLHVAETVIRDFLASFDHPFDAGWTTPQLAIHLEVVDLKERPVAEPTSLQEALPFTHYRGVRLPKSA